MSRCPCCNMHNPVSFWNKIGMGISTKKNCKYCQCEVKLNVFAFIIAIFAQPFLIFLGFLAGVEIFKTIFSPNKGLSLGYFVGSGIFGVIVSIVLLTILYYIILPFKKIGKQ